ncbi:MAG TPA: hypothetical protein PLU41_16350 [Acidobacteriota bacterium]|nr:hypothetical protein [Acidobacteriota bacterium]HQP75602.1 hypothetical protein [Acidobacteriota bacterium]
MNGKLRLMLVLVVGLALLTAPALLAGQRLGGGSSGLVVRQLDGSARPGPTPRSDQAPAGYTPQLIISKSSGSLPTGGMVCVFKDVDPWGSTSVEGLLLAGGMPYAVHTSAEFGTLDFSAFGLIVVSSDQTQTFYDNYAANAAKFTDYVVAGGTLFFSACDQGWNTGQLNAPLPGGMVYSFNPALHNNTLNPCHPTVHGVPNPFWGNWVSHGTFSNVPAGAEVIAVTQGTGLPTLVEYTLGSGIVLASALTLEIAYDWEWDGGRILANSLPYLYNYMPPETLVFVDDYGRSMLCVDADTGYFAYRVLTGKGAGQYQGEGIINTRGSVLYLMSPRGIPWQIYLVYDMANGLATAYFLYPEYGVRSMLYDRNMGNNPTKCLN